MTPPVFETITPAIAAKYLESNNLNRPIDKTTVSIYNQQMTYGGWKATHQGIAFDINGTLQDGQHRLLAIIASNTSQQLWVFRNMPVENFAFLDNGRVRSTSDILALSHQKNSKAKATIVKFILSYNSELGTKTGALHSNYKSGEYISSDKVLRFTEANQAKVDEMTELAVEWTKAGRKMLELRFIGGIYWNIADEDKEMGREFFERLTKNENISESGRTSAIYRLYQVLSKNRDAKRKIPRDEKFALTVKAWNAFLAGKEVTKIVFTKKTEEFPTIASSVKAPVTTEK